MNVRFRKPELLPSYKLSSVYGNAIIESIKDEKAADFSFRFAYSDVLDGEQDKIPTKKLTIFLLAFTG